MDGRRGLDTAEGILIALRHCTADEAFQEMIGAAQRRMVPIFSLADALVSAASGDGGCADTAARHAVDAEWGALLVSRAMN